MVVDFAASSARTASGSAGVVAGLSVQTTLRVQLDVTAAAGTSPTLTVTLEDTIDGTNWNTIGTFAQKAGPGREVINIATPFADRVRASWVIGGTAPSFTFSVVAHAE